MFDWPVFLTYAIATTITPGPNTIASMSNGSRKGFFRGLPLNLGMWCGFSIVMLLCAALTSLLAAWVPMIKTPMLFVGAAYLLWLAWKTIRRSSQISETEGKGDFLTGFAMQFVNPKVMLYGIMSFEAYILPVYEGRYGILACFAFVLSTIGFVNGLLWSAGGSVFRVLFSKHAKWVNAAMALLLVWCALKLLNGI
jgi:threonine/homoserine/homoserine lactone efflux protein